MRAASILARDEGRLDRLVNSPADTAAIDDEDGAIFGNPFCFCAGDTSRLTINIAQEESCFNTSRGGWLQI
jgi:hypothetical protein